MGRQHTTANNNSNNNNSHNTNNIHPTHDNNGELVNDNARAIEQQQVERAGDENTDSAYEQSHW